MFNSAHWTKSKLEIKMKIISIRADMYKREQPTKKQACSLEIFLRQEKGEEMVLPGGSTGPRSFYEVHY